MISISFLIDLNIEPIIVDENVFERDAVQLNISWKSANLGCKLENSNIILIYDVIHWAIL